MHRHVASRWARFVVVSGVVAGGALASACGGGGGTMETPDAGGMSEDAILPDLTTGTMTMPAQAPADYACFGTRVQPTPGDLIPVNFQLQFFGDGTAAKNVMVWFFPENVISDTCDPSYCQEFTSSADTGTGTVMAHANGWYAYHVFPHEGGSRPTTTVDSVQYNEAAPAAAGGSVVGNAVSQSTIDLIPAVLGYPRALGTALLSGEVQDCTGTPVYGAHIRVYDETGARVVAGDANADPHFHYFAGDMATPDAEQQFTNADGIYTALNIPVPASPDALIRIEAWGRRTPGGDPERIGCEAVRVFADAVTIVNVGPLRGDYPAGHPCAE